MSPYHVAIILIMLFGSLFLGGAVGRSRARGDRLASGQVLIGWICLVLVSGIAWGMAE